MRFVRYFDLETMCLNVIAANLDFYIENVRIPENSIRFLRRVYSDPLYQILDKKEIFNEKYLQWLLSFDWKNVTLQRHLKDYETVLEKLQVMGSVITSLNLRKSLAGGNLLTAIICCTPNVTHLDLSETACSDATLICIRRMCPSLVALDLSKCFKISDNGMANLFSSNAHPNLELLRHLNIIGTNVNKNGVYTVLRNMPCLSVLKYERLSIVLYNFHKAHIFDGNHQNIRYNLTEFEHYFNLKVKIFRVLEVWSVFCPYLSKVFIQDCICKRVFHFLSKFRQLKELKIQPLCWENDFANSFNSLLSLSGEMLTRIYLQDVNVAIDILVLHCKNLRNLYLKGTPFKEYSKNNIKESVELKHLDTLIFNHADFSLPTTSEAFYLLLSLSTLKKLCFRYAVNVSEDITNSILRFSSKLEIIDFSFTDIKSNSLLPFFNCPSISKFYIDSCINVPTDENSVLSKFIKNCEYGNTCSWHIDFNNNRDND